jgi:hypothetical protein
MRRSATTLLLLLFATRALPAPLDFWAPATMKERCFDGLSMQQGEATYDSYRKYTVETRESLGSTR